MLKFVQIINGLTFQFNRFYFSTDLKASRGMHSYKSVIYTLKVY